MRTRQFFAGRVTDFRDRLSSDLKARPPGLVVVPPAAPQGEVPLADLELLVVPWGRAWLPVAVALVQEWTGSFKLARL